METMTFEKTYEIKNNELNIKLPKKFKSIKKVRVIVEEVESDRAKKLNLMKKAVSDPLFNADVEEINSNWE
jgi:hypothetical protein